MKIGWSRADVPVTVDGMRLAPAADLDTWAAFAPMGNNRAMVMGDTVVFQDEVDAAMVAALTRPESMGSIPLCPLLHLWAVTVNVGSGS